MATGELTAALDAAQGHVSFWWRDDDAGRPDPRLEQLLLIATRLQAPLALAVVPAWMEPGVARAILAAPSVTVIQHGITHAHNEPPGAKKIELGGSADREALRLGLGEMRERLAEVLGERFFPVLAPPWNRISDDLVGALADLGFEGLTCANGRHCREPLPRFDIHLDLVAWRENARRLDLPEAARQLAGIIRKGTREPIGILSHHLVCESPDLAAIEALFECLCRHPKARLLSVKELFGRTAR